MGRQLRDVVLAAARWQARTLNLKGTGRVMKSLYPVQRADDDYVEDVQPYGDGVIQVDTRSYIEWSIHVYGAYDPATVELLKRLAHPGAVVLDVGANVGIVTLPMARVVGPTGSVHAFEPHPAVRSRLKRNVALNNLSNVTICGDAIGSAPGRATLYGNVTGNDGAGSLAPAPTLRETFTVEVRTLDSYTANLAKVDLIKIDVEGADYGVLEGARATIERWHPAIYIEVCEEPFLARFNVTPAMVLSFFKDAGYEVWRNETREDQPYPWRLTPVLAPRPEIAENWLAVHP
jgi:FkbM family methyltransferase